MECTRLNGGHHYHFTVTIYLSEEIYMPHLIRPSAGSPYSKIIDPKAYCEEAIKAVRDGLEAMQFLGAHGWTIFAKGPDWTECMAEMKWTAHNARYAIEQMVMQKMPGRLACQFHVQPKDPRLHQPVGFGYENVGLFARASEEVLADHYRQDFYSSPNK